MFSVDAGTCEQAPASIDQSLLPAPKTGVVPAYDDAAWPRGTRVPGTSSTIKPKASVFAGTTVLQHHPLNAKEDIPSSVMPRQAPHSNAPAHAAVATEKVSPVAGVADVDETASLPPHEFPQPRQAEYERMRHERIAANMDRLRALGLAEGVTAAIGPAASKRRPTARKKRAHQTWLEPVRRSTRTNPNVC
jgi:hypothetical protein